MDNSIQWRVYYGDGRTIDNLSCTLELLSREDVQLICQHDKKHNRGLVHSKDFYVYRLDAKIWLPLDWYGLIDYNKYALAVMGAVLTGRYISNHDYDELKKLASADPDFLPESAGAPRFER